MKTLDQIYEDLNLKVQRPDEDLEKQASKAGNLEEIWARTPTKTEDKSMQDFEKIAGISEEGLNQLCVAAALDHLGGGMNKQAADFGAAQQYVINYCSQFNKEATMQKIASFQTEQQLLAELQKMAQIGSQLIWRGFIKAAEADANGTTDFVAAPGQVMNDAEMKTKAPQNTVADGEITNLMASQSASIPQLVQKAINGAGGDQNAIVNLKDPVTEFIS